jgi:hypothetical protein
MNNDLYLAETGHSELCNCMDCKIERAAEASKKHLPFSVSVISTPSAEDDRIANAIKLLIDAGYTVRV